MFWNTSKHSKPFQQTTFRQFYFGFAKLGFNSIIHDTQSSQKRLIRRIFTPTFHVLRLKNPSGDSSVHLFFSISMCIIIVNFSLCSDQRSRLGVKINYCQQIKKITEVLRLSAWCLSENGRRDVHVESACCNSQSEARIWQWINTVSPVN